MSRVTFGRVAAAGITQTFRRLSSDMGAPKRALTLRARNVEPFETVTITPPYGNTIRGRAISGGEFRYAGQILNVGEQGDPWDTPAPSERFAFWLHSFSWLNDLATLKKEPASKVRVRYLVDRWIEIYGHWNPYAWEADVLTNRLFAWLSHWSEFLTSDNLSDLAAQRRMAVIRQLKHLRASRHKLPDGLPALKAAATLALGGTYLSDNSNPYLNQGLDDLNEHIDAQILPDGGHISRNPEDCLRALEILQTLSVALKARNIATSKTMDRAIERLHHVVPFFLATDGALHCFNGGGENEPGHIKHVMEQADFPVRSFSYCPHTGYQRIAANETVIIMDTGKTTPTPYDSAAHLAPLALEISSEAGRLITNCAINPEQPRLWHQSVRETAAHSTLVLNGQSCGEILQDGLKADILGPVIMTGTDNVHASRKEQPQGTWLETAHEGYLETTGLTHRRRLYVKEDGTDLRGEDSLLVPLGRTPLSRNEIPFDIRFHLHPSVKATPARDMKSALLIQSGKVGWRFRTDGGPVRIEDSVYLGSGVKPIKSQQIVISGRAFADSDGETASNRVRWSLRRLDMRA